MALIDTDGFAALLAGDRPLIDTRSPVEFARGSFPTATNLPLMTDDERAQVGTCYKQAGQAAAIALGHTLVSGATRQQRIDAWLAHATAHPGAVIFCFRGGMRSQIVQGWLAEAGLDLPRVEGGYKALRAWLSQELERICASHDFVLVSGRTGAAKTRLLTQGNGGAPLDGAVDLEGLANHRGSAFGRRPGGQPTQIGFEIALGIALLKADQRAGPILLEDESRLIGRCSLPPPLQEAMARAPIALLESRFGDRVDHSFENYILDNLSALERQDPETAFTQFGANLHAALDAIRKRLGGARYQAVRAMLADALDAHQRGDPTRHRLWIAALLRDYYDPMYDYQLASKADRVCWRGDADTLGPTLTALATSGRAPVG